jgi:short-subunit dehydrogenase
MSNQTVWITGASSGIGAALAYAYAQKGCKLILSGRNAVALEEVKNKCAPQEVAILPFDLADTANAENNVAQAMRFFGNIDLFILNGGVSQRSLIAATDLSVYERLMQVDYLGNVALAKAMLPYFIRQKSGHFVVTSSVMGKYGSPYRSGYCGAKHALHGFFDVLRMEHEKDSVSVTMVCPGFIKTNASRNALTANGSPQNFDDPATVKGMPTEVFAQKCIKAVEKKKFEVCIGGGKEILGVYLKRFFPTLLHRLVLKNRVK